MDATKLGAMTAGAIRAIGAEAGLGVNMGAKLTANGRTNTVTTSAGPVALDLRSGGNLTTNAIAVKAASGSTRLNGFIAATETFQQTGVASISGDLTVTACEVFVPKGGRLGVIGALSITADSTVTIDGELAATSIAIQSATGRLQNTGFIFAKELLKVEAGEAVGNTRQTVDVYEVAYDVDARKYVEAWKKTIDEKPGAPTPRPPRSGR
ncbi:hypothetical protein ACFQ4O_05535 [Methylopila musalis]|uniref:Polymer-forming cytoskeletal n=1 Tax=Methylopila musalis TaxID=1134781 RepID=A0ABW3Z6Y4_9HYPH